MILPAVLIIVWFLGYIWYSIKKPKNFPPGPAWKPMVGSLPILTELTKKYGYQHLALSALSKQWNTNILGLKLGDNLTISVEDYPTIKEILSSEVYDQRPVNYFTKLRTMETGCGITFSEGEPWKQNRKFVTRYMRTIAKNNLDAKINEEILKLIEEIDTHEQVPIGKLLQYSVVGALWSCLAGKRVDDKCFEQNQLLHIVSERTKAFDVSLGALGRYPWLRFIIPEKSGYSLITRFNRELKKLIMQTINEHSSTWTVGNTTDFIYSYIDQIRNTSSSTTELTEEQLLMVCVDLFLGGSSTVEYTLQNFFLLMILHQNVQSKIHELLDETFEANQRLEYQDRLKVPYIEAVINEVHRYAVLVPTLGPRRTIKETTLGGYNLPKNTTVLLNLYPTCMSEEIWGDPHTFRPERFLNGHGELISYPELMPFGLGRRRCVGDSFAKECIFMYVAELLRTYKILPIDENNLPSITPVPAVFLTPQPYLARFVRRL